MASIHPHINFNGNAEEAFTFYQSVFGGAFSKIIRFKDLANDEFPVAEHEANKIMHIALPIGKNFLMANDVPEILGSTNENENRSKIVITAESKSKADKLFNGLSEGGQIEMPISDSPYKGKILILIFLLIKVVSTALSVPTITNSFRFGKLFIILKFFKSLSEINNDDNTFKFESDLSNLSS